MWKKWLHQAYRVDKKSVQQALLFAAFAAKFFRQILTKEIEVTKSGKTIFEEKQMKKELAKGYRKILYNFPSIRANKNFMTCGLMHEDEECTVFSQLRYLADKIEKLEEEGKYDAAERALGFIHGALWVVGEFDLETLRKHLEDTSSLKDENTIFLDCDYCDDQD